MNTEALMGRTNAFQLLHPEIQEQLYRMNWLELRRIQEDAIQLVVQGTAHLLISAPTAGGKTEAAFLPILSQIIQDSSGGVRAVYVSPLKALINDQFRRLEDLCQRSGIPVHRWHGDVAASTKKELRDRPSGVLLITPESVESLFINYANRLDAMFHRLAFVVIDELHSFLGTERGAHLHSLLFRLIRRSQSPVRLLGLSATFGAKEGLDAARRWLSLRPTDCVQQVEETSGRDSLRYQIKGYLRPAQQTRTPNTRRDPGDSAEDAEVTEEDRRLVSDLFLLFRDKTALVFANNKMRLEFYGDLLARHCERSGIRNPFRVHHGSLSKAEREETEEALRSEQSTVAFCSSTLELGIDVGNVALVGQIGPPWSVSSQTQRLGRSGRGEGEVPEMRVFIEEDEPESRTSLVDRLFPSLLQAVAVSESLLAGWSEPPADRLHASTLVQQILSVIKQRGGARADQLFEVLVQHGAFRGVDQPLFVQMLRSIRDADLIEQTPQGDLILGLAGEKIVHGKDFYAAFLTGEEYVVLDGGRRIGSVDVFPATDIDQFLILAGRRWRVLDVNRERRMIFVKPARGGRLPRFRASGGPDIHPCVRSKMREILLGSQIPVYLDAKAQEMLAAARQTAQAADLARRNMVADGRQLTCFTWTGTRIQRTLQAFARYAGLFDSHRWPRTRRKAIFGRSRQARIASGTLASFSLLNNGRAAFRSPARMIGEAPLRIRLASSPSVTSRT